MIKDPLTQWDGLFPYDALAAVGITPASSMGEVMDASFELMAQRLMTPEVRQAWDELRFTERRLFVDFFLYQLDLSAAIDRTSEALEHATMDWVGTPDLSPLLTLDPGGLYRMEQDFRDIPMESVEVHFLSEFDREPPLAGLDVVEFDR